MKTSFVELLARSNFSFLQGASYPEEMVEQAILYGYQGIALCDVNGLYGTVRGFQTIHQPSHFVASLNVDKNFQYLIGAELTLVDEINLVLTPMNRHGYSQLCEILTKGKRNAAKGFSRLSFQDICTGCDDCLIYLLPPWNEEIFEKCEAVFGHRLYVPLWRDLTWDSRELCQKGFQLELTHGAQLFATQRPLMHQRSRKPIFDILTCLFHGVRLEESSPWLAYNGERCLRPMPELQRLWSDRPDLLSQTCEIADRVNFSLKEIRYRYPQGFLPESMTSAQYLSELAQRGLRGRFPNGVPEKIKSTMEYELSLIKDLEYEDYFLTLREICEYAEAKGILYQGRGSAANSVVCYALGLTAVNPEKIDMLFERFISRERNEPPDIDIDFEHERREEVLQHIYEKYGSQHAAMVCNVICFRSRSAFRETAKAFGVPLEKVNAIIKFMGRDGFARLQPGADQATQFGLEPMMWASLIQVAKELVGFPRHLGIHSGGFIITQNPLAEMVPVEKATKEGRFVVQWNKDDVQTLGLMKIDLLSLGMLTCLRKTLALLEEKKQLSYSLASLPAEDKETYEMISRAETIGVFQIESRAQMQTLPRMRPENFYDLVVEVALVRPGPLQGGMVHPYLRRRASKETVQYPHEDLRSILQKTYGVPIFQEQIMQLAVVGAGFTPGEADELRRIMSAAWRRQGVMGGIRDRIMTGLAKKGISGEYAEQIYRTIEGFASYGFPESHAASFALLTYASCYLKCHHPDAFTCALLNSQPMGFYSPRALIAEARRQGVLVLDLDVNQSFWESTLEKSPENLKPLRLGFSHIKGFSRFWAKVIESERGRGGAFESFADFCMRTELPGKLLEQLALAGAFQLWHSNPRDLLWLVKSMNFDQQSFAYEKQKSSLDSALKNSNMPQETSWEHVSRDYQTKGYSLDAHPVAIIRKNQSSCHFSSRNIFADEKGQIKKVRLLGMVSMMQRPPTAKGFCFITFEDEFGVVNIIIPPKVYEKHRTLLYSEVFLIITGRVERTGSLLNVRAESLQAAPSPELLSKRDLLPSSISGFSRSN